MLKQNVSEGVDLAARVFELREDRGWSQTRLAQEAKISITTVSSLERGLTGRVSSPTARKLAKAFGMSYEELLHPSEEDAT